MHNTSTKPHPHPISPITPQDLQAASRENPDTAGGLDGCGKRDLRWVTPMGFQLLADLYNHIENDPTHRWPTATATARAVFLNKDPADVGNPMAYWVLKVTSILYRLWATVRLRNLGDWVGQWSDPGLFAGVPGAGAEEAWYLTALDIENKRLTGAEITVGSWMSGSASTR